MFIAKQKYGKNNISWQTNIQLTKAGRQKPGKMTKARKQIYGKRKLANKTLAIKNKSQKTNIWQTKTGKQNPGNKEQKLANNYMINKKLAKNYGTQ